MSLIQLQDEAIRRLHEPRSSDKRHWKWTRAVRRWYMAEIAKRGVSKPLAAQTWRDTFDVYLLQTLSNDDAE